MSNSILKTMAGSFLIHVGKRSENRWLREFTNWKKGISEMSDDQKDRVIGWFDIGYRAFMVIGMICVLYLQANYVTKGDFAEQVKRTDSIEKAIIRLEANLESQKRFDSTLADHETRIRAVEKNQK